MPEPVRFATRADAAALVELRATMFDAIGQDTVGPVWRDAALTWFQERLGGPALLVVVAALRRP